MWWTQEGQDAAFEGQSGAGMSGGRKNQMVLLNTLLNGANYQEDDKPYWFNTKCYLSYIRKERMIYKGCPGKVSFLLKQDIDSTLGRCQMQQEADRRGRWHVSVREMQSKLSEFQLPDYDECFSKKQNNSAVK